MALVPIFLVWKQGIKHGQERRETLEADLAHTLASLDDAEQKVAADEAQIDAIRNELASSEPQLGQFEAREVSAYQDLTKGETAHTDFARLVGCFQCACSGGFPDRGRRTNALGTH